MLTRLFLYAKVPAALRLVFADLVYSGRFSPVAFYSSAQPPSFSSLWCISLYCSSVVLLARKRRRGFSLQQHVMEGPAKRWASCPGPCCSRRSDKELLLGGTSSCERDWSSWKQVLWLSERLGTIERLACRASFLFSSHTTLTCLYEQGNTTPAAAVFFFQKISIPLFYGGKRLENPHRSAQFSPFWRIAVSAHKWEIYIFATTGTANGVQVCNMQMGLKRRGGSIEFSTANWVISESVCVLRET